MRCAAFLALCLLASGAAYGDDAAQCRASGGTYVTGRVTTPPRFARGRLRYGVELSHTHIRLRSDQGGRYYDVAVDNVFAGGYAAAGARVPTPLSAIRVGDRLELCGKIFTHPLGVDWVHTNCGASPSRAQPDGWLKVIRPDGSAGANLEGSQEYCRLWR